MSENKEKEKIEQKIKGFIQGNTVDLVPLNSNHVKTYNKWGNDSKVRKYMRDPLPSTLEAEKKSLEDIESRQINEISFEIWHKAGKKPIGFVGLHRISWLDRHGEIGLAIGEPEYWGKGIASEAAKLIIDYCFKELNFHKVVTMAAVLNEGSWKVSENLGMKRDALLRDQFFSDGEYVDAYMHSILKKEWFEREKSKK